MTADIRYSAVAVMDESGEMISFFSVPLRIRFSFCTGMGSRAGEASIRVYGLNDSDCHIVKSHGAKLVLYGGTQSQNGMIFSGEIIEADMIQEDQVKYLSISVADGDSFFSSYIRLALGSGESYGSMTEKIVRGCSAPLDIGFISPAAYRFSFPRGSAYLGSTLDAVSPVARSLNAMYYVYGGRFYLVCPDDAITSQFQINQNALIGVPVLDNYYAVFLHEVSSSLSVGRFVSFGLNTYRILSIEGNGDTLDGPWEMRVVAMAQNGAFPNMTALTSNLWR